MDKTMMSCKDKNIKELLPAYLEQGLDRAEAIRVEAHLKTCKDCRTELTLLRAMVDEPVPDPGNAFWAEMPARIYRQVQKQKVLEREQRWPGLSGIVDTMILPRWAWAAAAVVVLAVTSWFIMQPGRKDVVNVAQKTVSADESPYEYAGTEGAIALSDLNKGELDNVVTWANSEMASLSDEIRDAALTDTEKYLIRTERDILYEDLSELNPREMEQLSLMLEKWKPEV
jgi:anti-sigma factor RsiW